MTWLKPRVKRQQRVTPVAAAKMREGSWKATFVAITLSIVLGGAVAVDSMLTRGGQRLAAKAEADRVTLYTDSGGKTLPFSTDAEENSGTVTDDRLRCFSVFLFSCPHLAAGSSMHSGTLVDGESFLP